MARSLGVRTGAEIDPLALSTLLAEAGYDRQDPVDDHGEYCVRGGILDVYPPDELWPIRIEFIGDMVESIRRFDPGTQRSVETLDQFLVVPVREQVEADAGAARGDATVFDYLTAASRAAWSSSPSPTKPRRPSNARWPASPASYEEAVGRTNAPPSLPAPARSLMPAE